MNRVACPDCGSDLGPKAIKCRCGWKAAQTAMVEANPNHVPCTGDPSCRFPGRMFVAGMNPQDRLCIDHYYRAIEGGAVDAEPPRRMLGLVPKPVAGTD